MRRAKSAKRISKTLNNQSQSFFSIELLTEQQKQAWKMLASKELVFLTGAAGSGKTFLAMAYAIQEVLHKRKEKIILTRPIVEAGESLGFLPGTQDEKVTPYMRPLYDAITAMVGRFTKSRDVINASIEVMPLAYMRGVTFTKAICIFDEAQNATAKQLTMFLTRLGKDSQIIINGDNTQSDIPDSGLLTVIDKIRGIHGIGIHEFDAQCSVRHPLVIEMLNKLGDDR